MTDKKAQPATPYGEGDIEAKAMSNAANESQADPALVPAMPPPGNTFIPASGTTETNVAENLKKKAERERQS